MYVGSDRPGAQQFDIFVATRTLPDGPFGLVTPIAELNTTLDDGDVWLTQNQRYIIFASENATNGQWDLFEATR
jgi:hypothetical protein